MSDEKNRAAKIAALNDQLRKSLGSRIGRWYLTIGVRGLDERTRARIITAVRTFDAFTPDNDPHGERDFGRFEIDGTTIMWKIDYYDRQDLNVGAEDASDTTTTTRVLTVMLAEEY